MAKHRSITHFLLAILFGSALLVAGCNENSIIRANVVPTGDNLEVYDTRDFPIVSDMGYDDSLATSTTVSGVAIYHALGWVNSDPYTGNLAGSVFLQFVPPTTGWKLPSGYTLDSAAIVLPYGGFRWGDTAFNDNHQYRVFRIEKPFSKDSVFYTKSAPLATIGGNIALANSKFSDSLDDSVSVNGVRKAPHIRIPLDTAAYFSALRTGLVADSTYASFLDAFPGLYIVPDTTAAGHVMPYVLLNGTSQPYGSASVQVYAHSGTTDTAFTFTFQPGTTGHWNRITRTQTASTHIQRLEAQPANYDTLLLHNEPGSFVTVRFPNIQSLPQGIINRAEIVLTRYPFKTGEPRYFEPARLYPLGVDSGGGAYNLLDRYPLTSLAPLDFIDGRRRDAVVGGEATSEYRINIARELQRALSAGQTSLTIKVSGAQGFPGAYRMLVGGAGAGVNPGYRMRLNLVYTRQQQ